VGDSVLFDTCNSTPLNALYSRFATIIFDSNAINLPWAPADSILDVAWQAIDTNYPVLRDSFQNLELTFGSFIFQKEYPDDTNSSTVVPNIFYLRFLGYGYYNEDTLDSALSAIPGIIFYLPPAPDIYPAGVVNGANQSVQNHFMLFPNPAHETIRIQSDADNLLGQIQIIDALGRPIKSIFAAQGRQGVEIDIHDLPTGSYSLRCGNNIVPFTHLK